uniref:Uncharacterized protein n=1 Tax=Ananas comosus var. bracteatus TaxID=296719 RepID=A0A6V7PUI5_ANACO|nr:unnamed protein product [Ananas comosus var. bracteatus]
MIQFCTRASHKSKNVNLTITTLGDLNWVTLLSRAQRPCLDLVPLREWWLCNNRGLSPNSQPNPANEEHRYNPLGTVCWVATLIHLKYSGNQCLGGATTAKPTDVM